MPLGLIELLKLRGLPDGTIKLVRHQDSRYDLDELFQTNLIETYQAFQARPVFDGVEYIVSFLGMEKGLARFVGVYEVGKRSSGVEGRRKTKCSEPWADGNFFYHLRKLKRFGDLENRVVIAWGNAPLAWHQRLTEREVVEILPKGQLMHPFEDYLDFRLSHAQLCHLFHTRSANADWRARLMAVGGIYLILATTTGHQYVGSAHGTHGIWGRWEVYTKNGHGGNAKLKELLSDKAYPAAFSYSLLQIVPRTMPRRDVVALEARFKDKLGSRATGLNRN